jgi:uncharacterized protein involved in exopolysaccharide biosynthesis
MLKFNTGNNESLKNTREGASFLIDDIDFKIVMQMIAQGRKWLIGIIAASIICGMVYSVLLAPLFKSTASLYPYNDQDIRKNLGIQGLATALNLDVQGTNSIVGVIDAAKSKRIMTSIIHRKWYSEKYADSLDLIAYWEINDTTKIAINPLHWIKRLVNRDKNLSRQLIWEDAAIRILEKRISAAERKKSDLIEISVWMEEPELSAQVANYICDAIVELAIEIHKQRVKLGRSFIEERRQEVQKSLAAAEERLTSFRERNRNTTSSPQLQLELERLSREVALHTEVFITLQQQFEIARIEEIKEMPSVVVLDWAVAAVRKDKPSRKKIVVFFALLGAVIGMVATVYVTWKNQNIVTASRGLTDSN